MFLSLAFSVRNAHDVDDKELGWAMHRTRKN